MKIQKLKRFLCWVLAAIAAIALCCVLYMQTVMRFQANKLVKQEEYYAASLVYDKIGSKKKAQLCLQWQTEKDYIGAKALLEAGDYDAARSEFVRLGEYKDSAELIISCDYLKAEAFLAASEFHSARELLLTVPADYPGRAEALEAGNRGIYDIGMDLALKGKYKDAMDQWQQLEGYADTEKLIFRAQRMLDWINGDERLINYDEPCKLGAYKKVYKTDDAYIVVPQNCNVNCKFMLYYPGGMDYELNTDFLFYYLMNPAPDTIAVFMRKNGIDYMEEKNSQALEIMDKAAAECGVFMHDLVVVGSSMGAYPAIQSPRLSMNELSVKVDCVLALDAGGEWGYEYGLHDEQFAETSKIGTEFYLFESPGIGMNHPPIKRMVDNGLDITMVGCYFDEHERMTYDAMGMGVLHWAVGDRAEPCEMEIYIFNKLYKE